jgi:hypothetical protein
LGLTVGDAERKVRATVKNLRDAEIPILATAGGYFWPRNREEAAEFGDSMYHRAVDTLRTARAVQRGLRRMFGHPEGTVRPRKLELMPPLRREDVTRPLSVVDLGR